MVGEVTRAWRRGGCERRCWRSGVLGTGGRVSGNGVGGRQKGGKGEQEERRAIYLLGWRAASLLRWLEGMGCLESWGLARWWGVGRGVGAGLSMVEEGEEARLGGCGVRV